MARCVWRAALLWWLLMQHADVASRGCRIARRNHERTLSCPARRRAASSLLRPRRQLPPLPQLDPLSAAHRPCAQLLPTSWPLLPGRAALHASLPAPVALVAAGSPCPAWSSSAGRMQRSAAASTSSYVVPLAAAAPSVQWQEALAPLLVWLSTWAAEPQGLSLGYLTAAHSTDPPPC